MQGRFFSILQSINRVAAPLSLAITSPLVDRWGVHPFWFVGAAALLAVALIRRFVPSIYTIEDHPDAAPADA